MLTLCRRKERKAVSARNDTFQCVPSASKAAVPAPYRESYRIVQDIIAPSRAASKSEAPRAPATVSYKSALKTTEELEDGLEELEDDLGTPTWIRNKALAIKIPPESYVDSRLQSVVSIFRVPNFLKELKKKAYVPQIVSLGPYHSKRAQLSRMDPHKKRALHRMMTRFNNSGPTIDPDNMDFSIRAIYNIFQDANKIKSCYDEKLNCKPESLAEMLTLDGCFILEIFRTLGEETSIGQGSDKYEPIFESTKIDFAGFDILNDILMLENQVPLTVLRQLLEVELTSVDNAKKILLDMLVKTPGTKFYPFDYEDGMKRWSWQPSHDQAHHLLGLLHSLIVSPPSDEHTIQIENKDGKKKSRTHYRFIPPALELSNAGIKFQRRNGGIMTIGFDPHKATIYLPPINVTDHTEVLFRNLIALEVCKPSGINYVTCYLSLMNKLIDTEKDVALLRHSAVLNNYIGSDAEVAALFNGLCKGVTLPREAIFEQLQDDVMKHYGSNPKVWWGQFTKKYFSSPWNFLALAGAIFALLLAIVQTVCSILQVHK